MPIHTNAKTFSEKCQTYLWLFSINFFISAFTFGGGYVVIPMVRKYFVLKKKIISEHELLDLAAIAQSTPGAVAVNLVSLAGYRTAGLSGAFVSLAGSILPPFFILALISVWYEAFRSNLLIAAALKGMEAAVAALIVDLVITMYGQVIGRRNLLHTLLVPAAFAASFILEWNAGVILLAGCAACILSWKLASGFAKSGDITEE